MSANVEDGPAGDGRAAFESQFEALYRAHVDSVMRYAARRCADPADAADLVAGTFLSVLESLAGFDPDRGELRAWIIGIASRQHANRSRRRARERAANVRSIGRDLLSDEDSVRLDARIDAASELPHVEQALARLPDRHREALWLVGYDNLTSEQAAAALHMTPAAFRMRLSRARRALRTSLPKPYPEPAPIRPTYLATEIEP